MTGRQDQALADAKSALELSNRIPDKALELANSALKFANEGDWETQAFAYAALGSCYASLGRGDEAIRHVNEAQKIAFELRLTYVLARIHQARGWVAYTQGNSVLAFSDWQIAYDYFQQIRDVRGTAWILMHYAQNYASLGLIDHSIRCQISALDLISMLTDAETFFELKVDLARSYIAKAWAKSFIGDKGFSAFDAQIGTAILLDVLHEDLDGFAPNVVERAFQGLGEALLIQGRASEALPNLKIAYNMATQNGHFSSEARVLGATGFAHLLTGDQTQAVELLRLAVDNAPEATSVYDLALINQWNSIVLEADGNQVGALYSLRTAIELEQRGHVDRMERWSKVHDMTLGIGKALVSVEWIGLKENGWVYTDTELRRHGARVQQLLKDDHLTGVHSRIEVMDLVRSKDYSFAAIFEIQNLAAINRAYGRRVGDEILRNFASVLAATLTVTSAVGRYSGNEFFVAMNNNDFDTAFTAVLKFPWRAIHPDLQLEVALRRVIPNRPHLLAA
jgi:GGDEF domain-containing protein